MLMVSLVFVFTLSACLGGSGGGEVEVDVPNELDSERDIELLIWHAFGDDNMALLDNMFESFEEQYPNVSVRQVGQGGYDGLRESTIQGTVSGSTPDIVFGYPDHFVEYLQGNSLVPLDDYIEHPQHGTDLDDFVDGFMAENQQYLDGNTYSLPFAKSTEMTTYNKTVFDYFDIEIGEVITTQDVRDIYDTIEWNDESVSELTKFDTLDEFEEHYEADKPHILNYDNAANHFITATEQWDLGYTTGEGAIEFNTQEHIDMIEYYMDMADDNIISYPMEWDEAYGSTPFKDGRVLMSQGSTAGTRHNVPDQPDGVFGVFELGIAPVVQYDDDNRAAIQQGPNFAMMRDNDEQERLASWLLMKYMTNSENTASFAKDTGYVPVRDSAFNESEYQAFLELADTPLDELSDDEINQRPFAQAASVAETQAEFYFHSPSFVGRTTSSNARFEVEVMMEGIYAGTRNAEDGIQRAIDELE